MKRVLWIGALCWGCGGSAAPAEMPAHSPQSEGDDAWSEGAEPGSEPDGEEVASAHEADRRVGPSTIRIDVSAAGESIATDIRILDGENVVASGSAGKRISARSGEYTLELAIKDGLVDRPVQRSRITLAAGDDASQNIELAWARVQLDVRVGGASDRAAEVDLMREGEVVATLKSSQPPVLISPGRYQAVVNVRGTKVEVPELMIPYQATRTIPVNVSLR